jgi:hypothetical protein
MKKILLIIIVIVAIISGCDKTEKTLKKIYGNYTLITYTVNGADSLSLYHQILGKEFDLYYDDVNNYKVLTIDGSRADGQWGGHISCRWQLINHDKIISITASYGDKGIGPFGENKTSDWEIVNLTDGKLSINTNYNGKKYYVDLN